MKICHIITTLVYGGAERLLVNFANIHADLYDYEVDIIYFKDKPQLAPEFSSGIRVHHVPLGRDSSHRLHDAVMEIQPDIIHTHLGHADFLGLWASRKLAAKKFCTMHNIWFKWNWKDYLIFGGYYTLFNHIAPDTNVIAISQAVADHVRHRLRVEERRVHLVYNGIPDVQLSADRDQLRKKLNIRHDAFCVLFVGRLRIQKAVDTLLDAIAQLRGKIPNLQVLIVGEGPEQTRLQSMRDQLGLSELVEFRGVTAAPEEYFAAADTFVLPSVFEGLPLVILEAFRAGLPVIASKIEGPRELIEHGTNGLLSIPQDAGHLSQQILHLYTDDELRLRIGESGYTRYRNRFTIEAYAKELARLYGQ